MPTVLSSFRVISTPLLSLDVPLFVESVSKICVGKNIRSYIISYLGVVNLFNMLYFKMSCVYCCSCLVCTVVILCIFVVLCV